MEKKFSLAIAALLILHSICYAGDPDSGYGTHIAVESKVETNLINLRSLVI